MQLFANNFPKPQLHMLKSSSKQFLLSSYRHLLSSSRGFLLYNTLYESNWLPIGIRNRLVIANRYIQPADLGSEHYNLRLVSSGRQVKLPPIHLLRHWQFAQSYRWATPFYAEVIRRLLAVHSAGIWIDIGANQGLRCLDAHDAGWQVWAYEPNTEALNFYRTLIDLNPWLSKPGNRQVQAAIGNQQGSVTIEIDSTSYLSSVSTVNKPSDFELERTERVPCLRMHGELNQLKNKDTNIIAKIDVEGFEVAVLEGFGPWLNPLKALLVEVTPQTIATVRQLLEQAGFRIWFIDEQYYQLVHIQDASLPIEGTFDLLAWPKGLLLPQVR